MNTKEGNVDHKVQLIVTWLLVGIPLVWGVLKTLQNAWKMFE